VLQLVVQRIMVEDHRLIIEHVVPSGPIRLQPERHPRRNLRFRPSMKGSVSKLGCEIRCGATLETRIFNENPHIRLKKLYLWLKYQCISLKNSECQNDRFLPHFQPGS
jgi:hypothetical protein